MRYLNLSWDESGEHVVLDPKTLLLKQVRSFIEQALAMGECVLIHSIDGNSRSAPRAYLPRQWVLVAAFDHHLLNTTHGGG